MSRMLLGFALIFHLTTSSLLISSPANALVGVIAGVVGGGALLDKAGDELENSIASAKAAGEALIGLADQKAEERLNQVNNILDVTVANLIGKTEEAALNIIKEATREVNALERQIVADILKIIREVECAANRTFSEELKAVIGRSGKVVGTHTIELEPPYRVRNKKWYCLWNCDPYHVRITTPYGKTFEKVRELMEESISDQTVTDETRAHDIVSTYEFLSSFALKTACFYKGNEDGWNREYIRYREKAQQWRRILNVRI